MKVFRSLKEFSWSYHFLCLMIIQTLILYIHQASTTLSRQLTCPNKTESMLILENIISAFLPEDTQIRVKDVLAGSDCCRMSNWKVFWTVRKRADYLYAWTRVIVTDWVLREKCFLSPTVMYRRCSGYIKLVFLYFCQ